MSRSDEGDIGALIREGTIIDQAFEAARWRTVRRQGSSVFPW